MIETKTMEKKFKKYLEKNFLWFALIILFGLSVLGIDNNSFADEWKITWFVIIITGWLISNNLK